jgi:ABC-type Fe3+/spermidine/putrescine transport system ATPase subunit
MSGVPLLAVRDLELARGGFTLRVPDLELRAGEALAVLGPNGAGKSTLLRALADLLAPHAGTVTRAVGREVALVFQRPVAFAGTVSRNVELPLWARRLPRAERRRRGRAALEEFGIAHLAERDAATLSGGELRRLALARAFATRPDVLLLDEPFDDLDPGGREALSFDLGRVRDETGVAVAMVTHDLRQGLLLADRVAVLLDGVLAQEGRRDDVLRHPASPDVARLVGMANLWLGRVVQPDAPGLSRFPGSTVEIAEGLRVASAERAALRSDVWVGVRPENVKLSAGRDPGATGTATVSSIVSDGVLVTAFLDWGGVALRTHLVAGRGLGHTLKRGDTVSITIRPEDAHLMPRS